VLRPSNCWVEGVVFVDPIQVKNPRAHWATEVDPISRTIGPCFLIGNATVPIF
jgi:hypothetical protein